MPYSTLCDDKTMHQSHPLSISRRNKTNNRNKRIVIAKKDPKDLSVEEKLKNLYQLQTTLSAIDEKRALRGELPLEVQDLEDEVEGLRTRVAKIKKEIAEIQSAITQKKGDMQLGF